METSRNDTVVRRESLRRRGAWIVVALICMGLSALATVPFFFMGRSPDGNEGLTLRMPITHDMHLHFEQMKSFYNGLASGEIYPRWEEDTNRGFGAPTTSYYPPGVYYITSFFYALTGNWLWALLNLHLFLMAASAAAIYIYARRVMSRGAAIAAMAVYIFLPYHILDQYQRGAIAELLGFIWMPLMMLSGERLFNSSRQWEESRKQQAGADISLEESRFGLSLDSKLVLSFCGLALSYGAFIWSHPPTAYQFSLAFGLFTLLLAIARKDWRGLALVSGAMAIGVALSAAYLYPAAVEQDLIRHEYISDNWPYHSSYVFVYGPPYTEYHRGFFNLIDAVWSYGAIAILIAAIALLLFKPQAIKTSEALRERVRLWVAIGLLASFMMTHLSKPVGSLLPKLEIGVFSWRMLSISTLAVALLAGACVQAALTAFKQRRRVETTAFASISLVIATGGIVLSLTSVIGPIFRSPVFVPSVEHINVATIPRTAYENAEDLPDVPPAELEQGYGEVSVEHWGTERRLMRVVLNQPDRLMIRTFNFPGWTATVDGQRADIVTGEEFGDIMLDLPAGAHSVTLEYLPTGPRKLGNLLTGSSFILISILMMVPYLARARKRSADRRTARAELSYEEE